MQIEDFLLNHFKKYPKLQIQDVLKGIHQSCFGCGHFVDREKGFAYLKRELEETKKTYTDAAVSSTDCIEPLAGGFCRVHLDILKHRTLLPETLFNIFVLSSEWKCSESDRVEEMLECFIELCKTGRLPFEVLEVKKQIEDWRNKGFPAQHHSEIFRQEYSPAYRVVRKEYCELIELLAKIDELAQQNDRVLVAIDGRCASGKTTLADRLEKIYNCNIFHMDDFFLQPFQRTPERFAEVGGNVDRERFMQEVLKPLSEGKEFVYRPYDCHKQKITEGILRRPTHINIIEGSYSMHPFLADIYDLAVFVDVDSELQKERIFRRNGPEMLKRFVNEWIVMEETYFKGMDVEKRCDIRLAFEEAQTIDGEVGILRRQKHEGCCN